MKGTDNILAVFRQADQIDLDEGLSAYFHYRQMMESLSNHYGYSLEQVAAAFSALSPNNDYLGNLRSLVTALLGHKEGRTPDEITVTSYRACARRAYLYLDGVPFLDHARGLKTRSFFINITQPWLPHFVTVDGHMVSVWKAERLRMKEVATSKAVASRRRYERVADDFRLVAHRLGILPNQVQAVAWFVHKRLNKIVFESQLNLLRPGDQWRLHLTPDEIKPYPPPRVGAHAPAPSPAKQPARAATLFAAGG